MRLSASRLKTYLTCPRQFRYRYVDELPIVPSGPLVFGQTMHATLRWLHESRIESGALPNRETAMRTFCRLWHEALLQSEPLFKPGTSADDCVGTARRMLAIHLKFSAGSPPPLLLEFPFEVKVGEHVLFGILDRVDECGEGLAVTDYKSGSRKPSPRDAQSDLPLTVYAHAVQTMFGLPVARVAFHHLRDGLDICGTREEKDFRHLTQEVVPAVAKGVTARRFAPKPGFWCRMCDFRELCQAEGMAETNKGEERWPTPSS